MPGFLHLDPEPCSRTDTVGEEQTGPMAAATRYLFCGHLPDRDDNHEDDAEEVGRYRPVHYLENPDAPYDWDNFFSQKVSTPVPEPDYLGQVWVTPDEDEWQAWWMRGGEQHFFAHGSREAMLVAAHDHIATKYFIRSKGENEHPLDWSAEGFPEPDWSAPVTELGPEDEAEVRSLCARELSFDPYASALPALLARRQHLTLGIRRGGRLLGFTIGSVAEGRKDDREHRGLLDLIVVAREFRRQGIARHLIERLEQEFVAKGCRAAEIRGHSPHYIWPGIDLRYTEAICAVEELGYRRGNSVVNMDVDLRSSGNREQEDVDLRYDAWSLRQQGIEVRAATLEDLPGLKLSWRPSWVAAVRGALQYGGGCEIALFEGRIVGFCAYGANHANEIGPLGTDERMRRKGIAGVVIKRALTQLRERGHGTAEIGWAGPLPYFSRLLEARIGRVFWQYEKLLDAGTSPSVDGRD
jgi:mycothiol synthase